MDSPRPSPSLVSRQLWRDLGPTLVLVTHDSSVARRAQRVGLMSKGRLTIGSKAAPSNRAIGLSY
jgi:ABC-type lipoprotein export system ATPase subunit